MPLPAIIGAVTSVIDGVKAVAGAIGGDAATCPGQPTASEVYNAIANGPSSGVSEFSRLWDAANPTMPFESTSYDLIARGVVGGSDCKISTDAGKRLNAFALPFIRTYGHSQVATSYVDDPYESNETRANRAASNSVVAKLGGGSGMFAPTMIALYVLFAVLIIWKLRK